MALFGRATGEATQIGTSVDVQMRFGHHVEGASRATSVRGKIRWSDVLVAASEEVCRRTTDLLCLAEGPWLILVEDLIQTHELKLGWKALLALLLLGLLVAV